MEIKIFVHFLTHTCTQKLQDIFAVMYFFETFGVEITQNEQNRNGEKIKKSVSFPQIKYYNVSYVML